MAFERQWTAVPPVLLTANGGSTGIIQVSDTIGFYVKMLAQLADSSGATLSVEIKRVLNSTTLLVGPPKTPITTYTDCSAFSTALSSTISAAQQNKTALSMEDRMLATYEQEPVNAWRTKSVDPYGNPYTSSNPFPVSIDGPVTIGEVEVKGSPSGVLLNTNSDGSIASVGLFNLPYDTISATYPTPTQTVYVSYLGGLSGAIQQTVTVNYSDSTQNFITTVLRTPVS